MVEEARGYASKRVNEAKGDVAQFLKVLEEYKKAPEVTRRRLYLESTGRILSKIPEKWLVDQHDGEHFLNILNLNPKVSGKNAE